MTESPLPPPTSPERPARRARRLRFAGRAVATLGLAGVFLAALAVGAALHVNLPASRRVASRLLSRSLEGVFHGQIHTGEIQELGLRGATLSEATVKDEAGNTVLTVSDLRIRTDVVTIVKDVLTAKERVTIGVRHVRANRVDALIVPDAAGIPTLVRALTPVARPSAEPGTLRAPARTFSVCLPQVELGRVYGRGSVAGLPTLEVTLGNVRGSVLPTPKGAAVEVHRYGMTVRGLGGTDATGTGEVHVRAPGAVWTSFNGYFGGVPLAASVHVKGKTVKVTANVPRALPEDVRALLADWPLREPVAAHVEASGDWPELQTRSRFEVAAARLTASGRVHFERGFGAWLDVQGRGIDVRAIWPTAPRSDVDVDTALLVFDKGGKVVVDMNGTTAATTLLGQPVPPVDFTGTWNDKGFEGKATLHETGMPLKVAFTVHRDGAVDLEARARSFQIERAPRLAKLTAARGSAEAEVKARIEKDQLDATLSGDVSGFSLGEVQLARAHVTGKAKGKLSELDKLTIDAKVSGAELHASGQSFARVAATARGPVTRPSLSARLSDDRGPEVQASAVLETRPRPTVRNLDLQVKRDRAVLSGHIATLGLDTREVVVDDLKLSGAGGELGGKLRVSKGRVELKASGKDLDLDVISRAVGLPRGMLGGVLNVDADIVAAKEGSSGHLRVALGKGSIASVGGIALSVEASLDGEHVEGKASGAIADVGGFGATWQGELHGSPALRSSWAGMTGSAQIGLSDVQLSLLRHLLPAAARVERIDGTASGTVHVERLAPNELPNVRIENARTQGLRVTLAPARKGEAPVELAGMELQLSGGIHGEKGDASGTTLLVDGAGPLISATGSARVSWRQMAAKPEEWLTTALEAPVMAVLTLHERPFAAFPAPFRPEGVSGSASARLLVSGPMAAPRLTLHAGAQRVQSTSSRRALPIDLRASGELELATGRFGASAELDTAGRRVARLDARGQADVFAGAWTGNGTLVLEGAPLAVVPALADAKVAGTLQGAVTLDRPREEAPPQMRGHVELSDVSVDGVAMGRGQATVHSDGRGLLAQVDLDDGEGKLSGEARLGLDWSRGLPAVDRERRVVLEARSRSYDIVVLSPFLRDVFSRLTGKVNGHLTATLEPRRGDDGKPDGAFDVDVSGEATVKHGVAHIAPLGIEFRDVSFGATARKAGVYTLVSVHDVEGKARSENVNLRARSNLYFQGTRLARGNVSVSMTEVPVLFQGVSQATASGSATLKLEREEERMVVTVDVPSLTARLPQTSGREVVDLADNPAIVVRQAMREPTPERSGHVLPWHFVVNLRRGVRLTRSDLDLPLVGQPVIDLGPKTLVGGSIELEPGGRFQSWGKTWVIEAGRVVFDTPEPSDPHLFATASWRAPDGTVVYVDVRGTLKDAKLTVTSDPARSEPEIMALLFGGGSSGSADEASSARTRETAAAGGIATAFNTLFADALVGSVELRTGTDENKASYTAAVRISENIWFEGTYRNRLEQQQSTTSTEPVDVSGTIDWRFRRNWSLRTEVGTLGTGLDLLWQYRY